MQQEKETKYKNRKGKHKIVFIDVMMADKNNLQTNRTNKNSGRLLTSVLKILSALTIK